LFVTQAGRERIAIHLFNLKTKKDLKMDCIDGFLVSRHKDTGWVERLEGDEMVLGRLGVNFKELDYFDLKKESFTGLKTSTSTRQGK